MIRRTPSPPTHHSQLFQNHTTVPVLHQVRGRIRFPAVPADARLYPVERGYFWGYCPPMVGVSRRNSPMLTDAQIRKAEKADKPYKLSDTGGLYLYVTVECKRLPPRSFPARRSPAAFFP